MSNILATTQTPPGGALASAAAIVADLHQAVLSGRKANTLRAYEGDLRDFARFMSAETPAAALDQLVSFSAGTANAVALAYRSHLVDRGLAVGTICRRLSALKAAAKVARMLGRVTWDLEVESPTRESYRDTSGPGLEGWRAMLTLAKERATNTAGKRNLAIVRLLHDCALRRNEVVGLDLADFEPARARIHVLGKGKTERLPISLPAPTLASLNQWVSSRGNSPGPLFTRLDIARGGRLTGESVRRLIVRQLGRDVDLSRPVRPHGLRHQGITQALDATRGDVRAVRKFSRHAKLETLIVYDDNRTDQAGSVASAISEE